MIYIICTNESKTMINNNFERNKLNFEELNFNYVKNLINFNQLQYILTRIKSF